MSTPAATFNGVTVDSVREVKHTRRGTKYPERVAWVVLTDVIPGFGMQGLVRMDGIKVTAVTS